MLWKPTLTTKQLWSLCASLVILCVMLMIGCCMTWAENVGLRYQQEQTAKKLDRVLEIAEKFNKPE